MPARPARMGSPSDVKSGQRIAAPFHPPADTTTFKDLLLFEERLKMNAEMLRRRKRRYEAFLVVLIATISFLAHRAVAQPPEHPFLKYLVRGLFAVSLVTLVLFYASGMYEERIRYANRYVPHANRSLRSINMHLNMRRVPRTALSYVPFLARRSASASPAPASQSASPGANPIKGKSSTSTSSSTPPSPSLSPSSSSSSLQVIPPIPPTTNPRGELIFSSRVDRAFKDGYERYRAAFEKRREEKMRERRRGRGWRAWVMPGRAGRGKGVGAAGLVSGGGAGAGGSGASTPMSATGSMQGGASSGHPRPRPDARRYDTPPSLASKLAADLDDRPARRRTSRPGSREPSPSGAALTGVPSLTRLASYTTDRGTDKPGRDRAESYSFILGRSAPAADSQSAGSDVAPGHRLGRIVESEQGAVR